MRQRVRLPAVLMTSDRDRSIEVLLRRRHQDDADVPTSDQCIDAEVLAAWVDGALSGETLAGAETHAAGCARCQALLASMARTTPATDPRPWWRTVTAKWLVPVAAIATALIVWVSIEPRQEVAMQPTMPAPAPVQAPQAAVSLPPSAPSQSGQQIADARTTAPASELKKETSARQARSLTDAERESVVKPQRLDALDKSANAPGPPPNRRGGGAGGEVIAGGAPVPASPPPPAASVASSAPVRRPESQAAAPVGEPVSAQLRAPADKLGAAESVSVTSERAKALGAGSGGGVNFAAAAEIRSPQPDYRWRILPPSGIQRSVDAGVTWSVVDPTPLQDALAATAQIVLTTGTSPSRDVCWIVGRSGIVLLTTDGATWQRRPIPEAVDITSIRAVDARTATVTTADQRRFATSDGGATWRVLR